MKKYYFILLFIFFLPDVGFSQRPNMQIGFTAGWNSTLLRMRLDTIQEAFGVGYQGGFYFRITKRRLYGEFGMNFIRRVSFSSEEELDMTSRVDNDLVIFRTEIPILAGYKPIKTPLFKFRVYTGLNTSFVGKTFNENEAGSGISREDFTQPHVGYRVGSGFDLAYFTFDLNYTAGITNIFKTNFRTQSHFWMMNFGILF